MKPKIRGLSHDHIDGCKCLTPFMPEFYRKAGLEKEFQTTFKSQEKWLEFMRDSSLDIQPRFSTITKVLQSKEVLKELGGAYVIYRAEQGYTYFEGTIAPQYHIFGGLNMKEVVASIYDGMQNGKKQTGLDLTVKLKLGIGREADESVGVEIAKIANSYDGEMILDLVCDEVGNPPAKHAKAYQLYNGPKDCHVENVAKRPSDTYWKRLAENLKSAIFELRCDSIGHGACMGWVLKHEPNLIKYIVDQQIRIAMCPPSNLTLGHITNIRQLRIDELLDAGVWLNLNPDDDLFLPDMSKVIDQCEVQYNFTRKQRQQLEANAIRPLVAMFR